MSGKTKTTKMESVPGGCLVLGFHVPVRHASDAAAASSSVFAPNAFIRIGQDETVTLAVNKSEMGQGVFTALPMIICEELEADWRKVRVASASSMAKDYRHTNWGAQGTGGSSSVASEWDRLRRVGAAAREMLVSAAAVTFAADRSECRAENGAVIHVPTGRRLTYGQLVKKASEMEPPKDVTLKQPKDFKLIGKPTHRLDTPEKTDGSALFGLDVSIPGMLTALIARSPVFGGKLKSFDAEKSKAIDGCSRCVRDPVGGCRYRRWLLVRPKRPGCPRAGLGRGRRGETLHRHPARAVCTACPNAGHRSQAGWQRREGLRESG